MSLMELLRLVGRACTSNESQAEVASTAQLSPDQRGSARCLEQLTSLMGQLMGACGQEIVARFVLLAFKQASKNTARDRMHVDGRPGTLSSGLTTAHLVLAAVQMAPDEAGSWQLCNQASILTAIRLSGWDPRSVQSEAAAATQQHCQRLQKFWTGPGPARFNAEQLRSCLWRLRSCRQWMLLFPAGLLPQARDVLHSLRSIRFWRFFHAVVATDAQVVVCRQLRRNSARSLSRSSGAQPSVWMRLRLGARSQPQPSISCWFCRATTTFTAPSCQPSMQPNSTVRYTAQRCGHVLCSCSWPSTQESLHIPTSHMPTLRVQAAQAAAATAAKVGTLRPAPVALFSGALQHAHWAVRHTAMDSLVAYTRAAVDDGDLRAIVPAQLLEPGSRLPVLNDSLNDALSGSS